MIIPGQSEASILTWRAERGRRRGWGWCRSYCRPGCATRSAVLFYFIFWLFYFIGFFYVDIKVFWGLLQELWKRGYRGPGIIWIEIWIKDQVTNFFHCGPINIFLFCPEKNFLRADIFIAAWCSAFCLIYDLLNQLIAEYLLRSRSVENQISKAIIFEWVQLKLSVLPFHQSYWSQLQHLIDLNFNIWIIRNQVAPLAIRK